MAASSANVREFHIPTSWRVRGTTARVYDVLSKPLEFVRWWPDVYLEVREVRAGDPGGVGRIVALRTKGWLPYQLRWQAEVLAIDKPHSMSIRARGDLDGRGEWRFTQEGELVKIDYAWTVYVTKPWMVALAPLLRPVFVANHRWAMRRGLEGLERELAR
jgi:uncharacterized protein YndB with AHSA1/START domain